MCCSKKSVVIFLAGAMAFHLLSHIVMYFAHILPMSFFGIMQTDQLNAYIIAISAVITVALLWWHHT